MDLRTWYDKRQSQIKKSGQVSPARHTSVLNSQPNLDQFVFSICEPLAIQYGTLINEDPVQGIFEFLTQQDTRETVQELCKSDFLYSRINDSIQRSWANIISRSKYIASEDLEKVADPKSWKRVISAHRPEHSGLVDHTLHMQEKPAPELYKKVLSDPKTKMEPLKINNGITAKMVHLIPTKEFVPHPRGGAIKEDINHIFMAKPYHKKIESSTHSWTKHPISGWATMATKGLFDAADVGHLAEDVYTHEHEGVPMTVHKFSKNMRELNDVRDELSQYQPDPEDLTKIGIMDFLANNLDRHVGNLMVSSNPIDTDARGYNKVLAIDHERNFQYHKTAKEHFAWAQPRRYGGGAVLPWVIYDGPGNRRTDRAGIEAPNDYIEHGRATGQLLKFSHNKPHYLGDVAEWWNTSSPKVKQEFLKHLGSIKDEALRKHLHDNFMARASYMDQWAKHGLESDELYDLNVLDSINHEKQPQGVAISKFHTVPVSQARKLVDKANLANPGQAIDGLAKWINQYGLSEKHKTVGHDLLGSLVERMSPDQAVSAYKHMTKSPLYRSKNTSFMRTHFLDHLRNQASPEKAKVMAQHLENTGNSQDAMWARQLKNVVV